MLTGIMAIFEMGLSLTGQSLLTNDPDKYLSSFGMKQLDAKLLVGMSKNGFNNSVANPSIGLCGALNGIEPGWSKITKSGFWSGGCQLTKGSHRIIVRKTTHQLFSCALRDRATKCSFEKK